MPTLTIRKTVTYTDPDSDLPYTITGSVKIDCSVAQRFRCALSPSTNTEIFEFGRQTLGTGKIAYICIKNLGADSAYIGFDDNQGDVSAFELAAGADFDLFGKDIYNDYPGGTVSRIYSIYAKGNTDLEVDIFL